MSSTKRTDAAMEGLASGTIVIQPCMSNKALLQVQNAFSGVALSFTITQGDLGRAVYKGGGPVPADPAPQGGNTAVVLLAIPTEADADSY